MMRKGCGPGRKMLFDSEIEFYARADSRRVFCEYAAIPIEQKLSRFSNGPFWRTAAVHMQTASLTDKG
jgi:hypothetical protein